jgi:WD40 repeat protein
MAAEARAEIGSNVQRSMLLATEAILIKKRRSEPPDQVAVEALRQTLGSAGGVVLSSHDFRLYMAVFSQDGRRIAGAGRDNVIRVWKGPEFDQVPTTLQGPAGAGWPSRLAFVPDARLFAAYSNGLIQVWRPDQPNRQPLTLEGKEYSAKSLTHLPADLQITPDGRRLVCFESYGLEI